MLRLIAVILLVLALDAPPALAAEKPEIALAKTTKWEMNYDKEACHLAARFGTGDESVLMKITRYQPGDDFDLALYGRVFKTGQSSLNVEVGFEPFVSSTKRFAAVGIGDNSMPVFLLSSVRLIEPQNANSLKQVAIVTPAQEAQVKSIFIKWSGSKRIRLETGPMSSPLEAMRLCVDDLVASWGYDPIEQTTLRRRPEPIGSPGNWITTGDYPLGGLQSGANGIVQFRLDIGPNGKVIGCHILYRTKPDAFADLTCRLLTSRARFKPALDRSNVPIRSYFISKVRWIIPD